MTESQKKLIEALGLTETDFQKNEGQTVNEQLADLTELVGVLTEVICGD